VVSDAPTGTADRAAAGRAADDAAPAAAVAAEAA
jgi:hypothetical protein